jgi:hypothetical protein
MMQSFGVGVVLTSDFYWGASHGENLRATQNDRRLLDISNHQDHQSREDVRNGVYTPIRDDCKGVRLSTQEVT